MTKGRPCLVVAVLCCLLAVAASAWAAGGWYLLVPPLSKYDEAAEYLRGYQVLVSEPLSKWAHNSTSDNAEACEAFKAAQTRLAHGISTKASDDYRTLLSTPKTDPLVLKTQRRITDLDSAQVDQWQAGRCIRSDDPRLR